MSYSPYVYARSTRDSAQSHVIYLTQCTFPSSISKMYKDITIMDIEQLYMSLATTMIDNLFWLQWQTFFKTTCRNTITSSMGKLKLLPHKLITSTLSHSLLLIHNSQICCCSKHLFMSTSSILRRNSRNTHFANIHTGDLYN